MKKYLAFLMAVLMIAALCGCGQTGTPAATPTAEAATTTETPTTAGTAAPTTVNAADIPDTMTSADGTYKVAFVTDVGQLMDKSFNQGTWEGVKLYAYQNNLSYKYYQPANGAQATDDDRYDAMKAAVDAGADVVVCAGFLQGTALTKAATDFANTKFVFIDGWALTDANKNVLKNAAGICFKEEQAGYFAGYAVVMDGYTKLGFSGGGGGTNPACCRYGYGYVQGAEAAAEKLGVDVDMNYTWQYGASYSASPELQTLINGWYENGTQIVFSCGGSIFESITAAASANDGAVVGVDVDQSAESDTVVTSAMKGLSQSVVYALGKFYDGQWDEIGGTTTSLGVNDDAVGLPTATWSMKTFTVEDYQALLQQVKDGTIVVDDQFPTDMSTYQAAHVHLNVV
jgi:Uncharacterized ABC-type transport system, periplasmic component/surface lipoprotein